MDTWIPYRVIRTPSGRINGFDTIRIGCAQATNSPPRQKNIRSRFSMLELLTALIIPTFLFLALTPFVSQMLIKWVRAEKRARLVELKTRGLGATMARGAQLSGQDSAESKISVPITVSTFASLSAACFVSNLPRLPNTRAAESALHGG